MGKHLVIVESPHKAQTIQKYLGKDYLVIASAGHIRDLKVGDSVYDLGVKVEENKKLVFEPIYDIYPGKSAIISKLKKAVKEADDVYLATDPDREGEAISWHLAEVLGLDVNTTKRLEFHEITYHAITKAINNPRTIDMDLVSSQETRRILDRIIGFRLSQLLQRKIHSPSAGRVQSVVLQLITNRQKEIDEFKESTYYTIKVNLLIDGKQIQASIIDDNKEVHFENLDEANKAIKTLENNQITLKSLTNAIKTRASKPIYTTSTMQQDAATLLKFDSKKTMAQAQSLYEGIDMGNGEIGLITYMRTDSVRVSPEFINKTKKYIEQTYGQNYVGVAKVFNKNNDNVQDAHEGIRPTDITITPDMVDKCAKKDEAKLYRIIYERALSSMMKDESYEHEEAIFSCDDLVLQATGDKQIFDGFTIVNAKNYKIERTPLKVNITNASNIIYSGNETKDSKTKGPFAYTEASLIDAMEKKGIGRPSTYATTIDLIKKHDYASTNKMSYVPTERGKLTISKLEAFFSEIINVEYTANMETKLDEIAENKCSKLDALVDFYKKFVVLYDIAVKEMEREDIPQEDLGLCPLCGKPLTKRKSKYGAFIGCTGYPSCHYIYSISKAGQPCPKCNEGKLLIKTGRFGKFYSCSNYSHCKYKESIKN